MTDLFSYQGKRVIVSGCASGIGREAARLLLEQGAEVHGLDFQPSTLGLNSFEHVDLREPRTIEAAVRAIGGRVDGLFNCAGVAPGRSPLDVLKVNFIGARHLTELVVPLMPSGGAVANVGSNGGAGWSRRLSNLLRLLETDSYEAAVKWCEETPETLSASYSFSKEAIIVWTMLVASRLIRRGIRVNCTTPGAVQTPMLEEIERVTPKELIDVMAQPIGRRSRPEEQACVLLMLNCAAASYLNGAIVPVDGGFMAARTTGEIDASSEIGRK